MTLASRLLARLVGLPPASHDILVEHKLSIPMPDGVTLLADRYAPREGGRLPVLLVRSPYGRSGFGLQYGRLFAERGFQVLVQSTRGSFGSGGRFDPFRDERADGLATLEWLKQQPWCSGEFALMGPSYVGFVQWAIARDGGAAIKALVPHITASGFRKQTYAGGAFSLDTVLSWMNLIQVQELPPASLIAAQLGAGRKLKRLSQHLPLHELDSLATGNPVHFFQEWLEHNAPDDPWWDVADHSASVPEVTAPVHLVSGWYDLLLPWLVDDYLALKHAGRQPYLTLGPWTHNALGGMAAALRESFAWFKAHLQGDRSLLREAPVRVFVMGANTWRDFAEWPPPGTQTQRWHLQSGRGLSPTPPSASEPDRYRYDPADPTPSVGGALLTRKPEDDRSWNSPPPTINVLLNKINK